MKKLILFASILGTALLMRCSGDEDGSDPGPTDITVQTVTNLIIDDVTNNANASDLQISFSPAIDETGISEYRVFVVPQAGASSFDINQAESISDDRYHVEIPNRLRKKFVLASSALDSDGNEIVEKAEYVVFVLSVADGTDATINAISNPSNTMELDQTTIKITYIGNDGVYISDGSVAVIIDALTGQLTGWKPAASGVQSSIERSTGDYKNVKIAMVTHNHGDHFSAGSINTFLSNNSDARLIAPPQALNSITSRSQILDADPSRGTSQDISYEGVNVRVLSLKHFDMFGNNFSGVENYGYLVEIGGKKILHLGDVDFFAGNFSPFELTSENIDAVLIPTFNTLISSSNKSLMDSQIGARKIVCMHLQSTTSIDQVLGAFPGSTVFSFSEQFIRL